MSRWPKFGRTVRARLHGGGEPQVGEVACGESPHLTCKRDQIKMRDYMDRRVTLPTWGPQSPCKQVLNALHSLINKRDFNIEGSFESQQSKPIFIDKNQRRSLSRPSDSGNGAKKSKKKKHSTPSKNLEQVMTGRASGLVALEKICQYVDSKIK